MKQLIVAGFALAAAGCLAIKVEDRGYEALRDASGNVLVDNEGKAQLVHKGQVWKYSKHWYEQTAELFEFYRRPGDDIALKTQNYKDVVSAELNKLVETSFKGVSEIAAKVAAAIATSGGSVAGESAYSALKSCISRFVTKGGNASAAKVECANGTCVITDGKVTESCANCYECGE